MIMRSTVYDLVSLTGCLILLASWCFAGCQAIEPPPPVAEDQVQPMLMDFSNEVKSMMEKEMAKLISEVESSKSHKAPKEQLEKFKKANEELKVDASKRLEQVAAKNTGQTTQSFASASANAANFMSNVRDKLTSAGDYMGQRMGSLRTLAGKISGGVRAIPGKLSRLMRWPSFSVFKMKFKKAYSSTSEEVYRSMVYIKTQVRVAMHNLRFLMGKSRHLLKATYYADYTDEEFQRMMNNQMAEGTEKSRISEPPTWKESMSPEQKAKLEEMAATKKTVFGTVLGSSATSKLRKKRATEYNEIDDDDDEDESSEDEFTLDDDDFDADEAAAAIDAYASEFDDDADLDLMDELEEELVDADFVPVDLRENKCFIRPENQDTCGCCFAHVVTTAASYYNCMQSKANNPDERPTRYNARFVSDCGRYLAPEGQTVNINGCSGGRMSQAYEFVKQSGIEEFFDYELARNGPNYNSDICALPRPKSIADWASIPVPFYKKTVFVSLAMNEINLVLRTVGPVFVNIIFWKDFATYGGGILEHLEEADKPMVHSMLIVGNQLDENGREYYIIMDSHGAYWGEGGYLRIYRKALEKFAIFRAGLALNSA